MKLIAALIAALCTGMAAAQTIDVTGNLVLPTVTGTSSTPWVNGVYQDQLTCWAPGMPGNCGPNPTVRPGNDINFSYGWTDLYQQRAISSVLPNSGTGLRINGYEYAFTAKNGNGWDDGRTDVLFAYVQFDRPDGTTLLNRTHNLSYKFDWTQFNFKYNFDTPVATKDVATVRYGFVGQDNNFWAGAYGPEITNVNFNLRYSVDPCVTNPLYSASCPGFSSSLANLAPPPPPVPSAENLLPKAEGQVALLPPPPPPGSTVDNTQSRPPEPQQQAGRDSAAPDRASALPPPPPPPGAATPSAVLQTQATATLTPAVRDNRDNRNNRDSLDSTPALGSAAGLAVVQRNREREQQTAAMAVSQALDAMEREQQAVTQQAKNIAAAAVANSETQNAVQITMSQDLRSQRSNATVAATASVNTGLPLQSADTGTVATVALPGPRSQTVMTVTSAVTNTGTLSTTASNDGQRNVSITDATVSATPVSVTATTSTVLSAATALASAELAPQPATNALTARTSNMNDIIQNTVSPAVPAAAPVRSGPTVNANTADNEAAGSVTIATMAQTPQGFGNYSNFVLRDAVFYAPREVYRNQRNIDNARALRALASDRLHQDMVEMQYTPRSPRND